MLLRRIPIDHDIFIQRNLSSILSYTIIFLSLYIIRFVPEHMDRILFPVVVLGLGK